MASDDDRERPSTKPKAGDEVRKRPSLIPTKQLPKAPDWAIALAQKMDEGFARQETRFEDQDERLETMRMWLESMMASEKAVNKALGELDARIQKMESDKRTSSAQNLEKRTSSARIKPPSAREIETAIDAVTLAGATSDVIENARMLCKRLRSSMSEILLETQILPTELEEALARYDAIQRKKPDD